MRSDPLAFTLRSMQSRTPQRFTLELDPAAEQIAGSLTDKQGEAVAFDGWLGLARALELARESGGDHDPSDGERPGGGPPGQGTATRRDR